MRTPPKKLDERKTDSAYTPFAVGIGVSGR
jgi:hypothetical protein